MSSGARESRPRSEGPAKCRCRSRRGAPCPFVADRRAVISDFAARFLSRHAAPRYRLATGTHYGVQSQLSQRLDRACPGAAGITTGTTKTTATTAGCAAPGMNINRDPEHKRRFTPPRMREWTGQDRLRNVRKKNASSTEAGTRPARVETLAGGTFLRSGRPFFVLRFTNEKKRKEHLRLAVPGLSFPNI